MLKTLHFLHQGKYVQNLTFFFAMWAGGKYVQNLYLQHFSGYVGEENMFKNLLLQHFFGYVGEENMFKNLLLQHFFRLCGRGKICSKNLCLF